jgi:hypothetical protein
MLERLKEHSNTVGVRGKSRLTWSNRMLFASVPAGRGRPRMLSTGVVLSPTRELAIQTLKFFRELGRNTTLRACLLVRCMPCDRRTLHAVQRCMPCDRRTLHAVQHARVASWMTGGR